MHAATLTDSVTSEEPDREARLAEALGEYRAAIDAGQDPPSAASLLARYGEVADELAGCLESLRFIEEVAPQLAGPAGTDAAPATINSLAALGDFRIVREIGRGGMGVVYEDEQLSIGRRVALKVLPFAAPIDPKALQRFRNEIRAVGTLDHPHIVGVYSVGEERGVHYYAMQLVRGQSLAEMVAGVRQGTGDREQETEVGSQKSELSPERPLATDDSPRSNNQSQIPNPQSQVATQALAALTTEYSHDPKRYFRRVAELGIQAAEALEHAHEQGILHRDIKPANLLVDTAGKLYVTDFGLARVSSQASMTASGDLVGTLRYMPPEQIAGGGVHDHRSDIYSLGATLYEAAALRPVFDDERREMLLKQITTAEPRPLRAINPATPAELERILLKALEKDPADRYTTAADLANDLRRFLDDQPIHARRPSLAAHARKWARRHPSQLLAATLALAVSLAAAVVAFSVSSMERSRAEDALAEVQQERDRANEERRRAEAERERAVESLKQARHVVDNLYMLVGTQWIADETAPSGFQESILTAAAKFYEDLAKTPITRPGDLTELSLVSSGYGRIGTIQHYLQNYEEAVDARQKSVAVVRQALSHAPRNPAVRSSMSESNYELGQSLVELARFDEALEAFDESSTAAQQLVHEEFDPLKHRYWLARTDLARAAVRAQTNSLAEAVRLARTAKESLTAISRENVDNLPLRGDIAIDRRRADYWLAKSLAHAGNLIEAAELCEQALESCRRQRTIQQDDARLRTLEADLQELSAEIADLKGDLPAAAEQYRLVLEMRREGLRAGLAPERFFMEAIFKQSINMDGLMEPGPFVGYVETHLRLARVLRRAGRPYAAEDILGECLTVTAAVVAERPNALRYRIADANAWTLAAELLADRRPIDAETVYRRARQVWTETVQEFPHAKEYVSGIHGLEADWERFEIVGRQFTYVPAFDPNDRKVNTQETVFHQHSWSGRGWARAGNWKEAIRTFKRSAALRTTILDSDHAYDWLQLAMAHAELGHRDRALEWFEKAEESLSQMTSPLVELAELRDEARSVVERNRIENDPGK